MPLRLHQEQLIAESKQFSLSVYDEFFTQSDVNINCFSWGNGKNKILLTHGWASKALDFYELIVELRKLNDVEIIAFDAPGNGSSISELSNLVLYRDSVKSISENYVQPDFIIGHSLGGMANALAIQELELEPKLLISLAPLIKLKENFDLSLDLLNINEADKTKFFKNFAKEVRVEAHYFNLLDLYNLNKSIPHFLAFDSNDHIAINEYLQEFLIKNPEIEASAFEGVGHFKIQKSEPVIAKIIDKIIALL